MSNKVKVVLNIAGFNALRKSSPMVALVQECAEKKCKALGNGYSYEVRQSGTRCVGKVFPNSSEAERDTFSSNKLLKG